MDRKERELEPGGRGRGLPVEAHTSSRTNDLLTQGDQLYTEGLFQRAVHVWTRILFVDRRNQEVRLRIKRAKEALAERQRQLDSQVAEAGRRFAGGDTVGATEGIREVLAVDARNAEALRLSEKIAAAGRRPSQRSESRVGLTAPGSVAPRGLLLRVSRQKKHTRVGPSTVASPMKMTAFVSMVFLLFAAGALFLHGNWDSIVSDGVAAPAGVMAPAGLERQAPVPPRLAELRYYDGARLFEKERYREALAQLERVERDSTVGAEARSLILRIEERLLRAAPDPRGDSRTATGMR